MQKTKLIAVAGPTASGKSGLAVGLAKALNGEVVSCDSMQVYMGMDIATAKVTAEETEGVPHHLLSVVPREQPFSVSDYVRLAEIAIQEIAGRGRVPIVAGGTGLYLRSLLYGVNFHEESRDKTLRLELEKRLETEGADSLYEQLRALDPEAAEKIHKNNTKRVLRALEYCILTGEKFSLQSVMAEPQYDFYLMGLTCRDRALLYGCINTRVDRMFKMGLLEEARQAYLEQCSGQTAAQAIGFKELFPFFRGEISLEAAAQNIKQETRRYAKRQMTWFNKEKEIHWMFTEDYADRGLLTAEALRQSEQFL